MEPSRKVMRSPGEMGVRSDSIMQASQPTAQQVAKTLPYLRRYARALTGNQQSGDSFVQATLEAVVADPSLLNSELPPRVAVYLAFQRIFDSAQVDINPEASSDNLERDRKSTRLNSSH